MLGGAPAHADALLHPDADPFYAATAGLGSVQNGAVLKSRQIALFGLPLPVETWQLLYRTSDSAGRPTANMTTVLIPNTPWLGPGSRPLLSYQIAEDSLGTRCAPSYALRGGWPVGLNTLLDAPFMADALRRGWAVVTSDYEGPESRFFDGVTSGRGVLDGIRAARNFAPDGVDAASPLGAYGYSGGAFATLWAAQLQPTYAPEVRFAGVTAGGVPADLPAIARGVEGGVQAGLALLIVHTTVRNTPEAGVAELLNDRGRAMLIEDADACGEELVFKYNGARVADFASVPDLLSHPAFLAATARQELGRTAPSAPMYLYHSTTDGVIPVAGFTALTDRYCAQGADITVIHSALPGHNPAAIGEAFGAMNYLGDRFAGVPVSAGCHAR
ncbi:lipase family protein [Nocardia sp. XZ_19_385]|uniref:lipase family protein n=1 Tax=Nocardia sp. XZ_19_385 TaxID=2769488 RepID=UPI00188E4D5B|nr:lipase family protein [Nocardia sp. XZ_19_385]